MPKYLDEVGLAHFWEIVKSRIGSLNILQREHQISECTTPVESKNPTVFYSWTSGQNARGIGVASILNQDRHPAIAAGNSKKDANRDAVGLMADVYGQPYLSYYPAESVTYTEDGAEIANFDNTNVSVGMRVTVGTLDRLIKEDPDTYIPYRNIFASKTFIGEITEVSDSGIKVDAWITCRSPDNDADYGQAETPSNLPMFIGAVNGLYGFYDVLRIPSSVPAGFKAYGNEIVINNDATDAMYVFGERVTFNKNGTAGFGVDSADGKLKTAYQSSGAIHVIDSWPTSDISVDPHFYVTNGGRMKKSLANITDTDSLTNSGFIVVSTANQSINMSDVFELGLCLDIIIQAGSLTINSAGIICANSTRYANGPVNFARTGSTPSVMHVYCAGTTTTPIVIVDYKENAVTVSVPNS